MDITLIVALIGIGILLVVGEIFIIPGTTFVGIIGGLFMIGGVIVAYATHDNPMVGHVAFAGTGVATVVLGVLAYRAIKSGNYALTDIVATRVNLLSPDGPKVGDEGTTVTALRPEGRAVFNDKKYAVFSLGDYVEAETKVKVTKVSTNKIYVKPLA